MIEIRNLTRSPVSVAFLRKSAENVLRAEKKSGNNLSIAIVDEKRMREISRIYKGKDKVSNVFSFPIAELFSPPEYGLGEVVLCKNEIAKDAKKYGITIERAMTFMLTHGILHLLGYSHKEMENK